MPVPVGALTLAGQAPTLIYTLITAVPAGALTMTGLVPSLGYDLVFAMPAGALSVTGLTPTSGSPVISRSAVSVRTSRVTAISVRLGA